MSRCSAKRIISSCWWCKQLVRDLALPVSIIGAPTLREADGLAMSSRNAYLSAPERAVAGQLNLILKEPSRRRAAAATCARRKAPRPMRCARPALTPSIMSPSAMRETLAPITTLERPARILAAAKIGKTRLIDNMAL